LDALGFDDLETAGFATGPFFFEGDATFLGLEDASIFFGTDFRDFATSFVSFFATVVTDLAVFFNVGVTAFLILSVLPETMAPTIPPMTAPTGPAAIAPTTAPAAPAAALSFDTVRVMFSEGAGLAGLFIFVV
jgi:hypothetical protein